MATNFLDQETYLTLAKPGLMADGDGLYLDVRSATSASWVFRFTRGKQDEVGLGSRRKVTLTQARKLRAWCLNELAEGRNPKDTLKADKLEVKRAAAAPKPQTVYELARDNIDVLAQKVTVAKDRDWWVQLMSKRYLGRVADMAPQDVTVKDVQEVLVPYYTGKNLKGDVVREAQQPLAEGIRRRLAQLLSWAKATGRITAPNWENPAAWDDNLEHFVNRTEHETKNHAAIPADEIGAFVRDLRARDVSDPAMRFALEWTIISAARIGEGCGADWSEIDWANDCWDIPGERMKMGLRHRVPLTKRHHEILAAILGDADAPEAGPIFVRAGMAVAVTSDGVRDVMRPIRKGITLHGFRATFSTWAGAQKRWVTTDDGVRLQITLFREEAIEESIAHVVGSKVRRDYKRDDLLDERRALLEAWAAYCGVVQEAKVVEFVRRPKLKAA